jgi:hypothetical protein
MAYKEIALKIMSIYKIFSHMCVTLCDESNEPN